MGYTHYWRQRAPLTPAQWRDFVNGFHRLSELSGVALADGHGEPGSFPEVTDDKLWFNGVDDEAHETCGINRAPRGQEAWETRSEDGVFDFCKTARKDYDPVVVAVLCYLGSVHPEAFSVSSDGSAEEWSEGLALARKAWPDQAISINFGRDE